MRIRANNIWSTPLMKDNQQSWSVLIINNDEAKHVAAQDKIDITVESLSMESHIDSGCFKWL